MRRLKINHFRWPVAVWTGNFSGVFDDRILPSIPTFSQWQNVFTMLCSWQREKIKQTTPMREMKIENDENLLIAHCRSFSKSEIEEVWDKQCWINILMCKLLLSSNNRIHILLSYQSQNTNYWCPCRRYFQRTHVTTDCDTGSWFNVGLPVNTVEKLLKTSRKLPFLGRLS